MKAILTALAVGASLIGGAAAAMTTDAARSSLELSAQHALARYGYGDTDVSTLTLSQLAGIKAITESGDYSANEREQGIGVILTR